MKTIHTPLEQLGTSAEVQERIDEIVRNCSTLSHFAEGTPMPAPTAEYDNVKYRLLYDALQRREELLREERMHGVTFDADGHMHHPV